MALKRPRLAVFISGFGSNLNIFLENKEKFSSLLVVSSKAEAYGLVRAREHGAPSIVLDKKIDWTTLHSQLIDHEIDGIFLAGFMRIVPASFIEHWKGRLFNLHPSMLPKYKGLKAIEQAVDAKDDVGVSIHHVVPEVDGGEVIMQKLAVGRDELSSLNLEQLTDRVHLAEHQLVQQWIDSMNFFKKD